MIVIHLKMRKKQSKPTSLAENVEMRTSSSSLHTADDNLTLSSFQGSSHFHPNLAIGFDNGLTKFSGSEYAKEKLLTGIEKQKKRIVSKLTNVFGKTSNVEMTITKRQQQNILFKCGMVDQHELKRHLVRRKHRWTEKEAAWHVSFCTRFYKYITKFVKDGVIVARFCVECDSFYSRIDNHLLAAHKWDKSDEKHKQLKHNLTEETEQFLHAPIDFTRFKYKKTKYCHFRKGKIY